MNRTISLLGVPLTIILLLPLALSFNCNSLSGDDKQICNQINSLNASQDEKDILANSAFYPENNFPNHDFVYAWNTNLKITSLDSAKKYNSIYIKDAWMKILTVMPSVLINNILYCDSKGKLQTEYNYRVQIPSGTERGDCRTDFSLKNNNPSLKVYLNNIYQGNQKLTPFQADNSDNLNFNSVLTINADVDVQHYKTYRYCCRYDEYGECSRRCSYCKYSNTETRKDQVVLNDNFNAKQYKSNPQSQFNVINQYFNVTKGNLTAFDFTSLILQFKESSYQESKYLYYLNYSLLPYYLLTLRAERVDTEKTNSLRIEKQNETITFLVSDPKDCKIRLFTHFNEIVKNCDINYQKINLSINTDKFYYNIDDIINVQITPSNLPIILRYGNQTKKVTGTTSFITEAYANRISAVYGDVTYDKVIDVYDGNKLYLAYEVFILGLVSYFTFSILTKPSFMKKWLSVEY